MGGEAAAQTSCAGQAQAGAKQAQALEGGAVQHWLEDHAHRGWAVVRAVRSVRGASLRARTAALRRQQRDAAAAAAAAAADDDDDDDDDGGDDSAACESAQLEEEGTQERIGSPHDAGNADNVRRCARLSQSVRVE